MDKRFSIIFSIWLTMLSGVVNAQTVVEYIHTDALGTPVAVTNAAGVVIERSEYEPYGQLLNRPLTDGPGFTGHVQDAATGLTYMQQRYYDPMCGCFLSVDPVTAYEKPLTNFNRYAYANNNPYKFTDLDGRESGAFYTNPQYQMATPSSWDGIGLIADFIPGIGDAKGVIEAVVDPSLTNIAAAGVGLVPIVGDVGGKIIKQGGNIAENAAKGAKAEASVAADLGGQVAGKRVTLEASTGQRSVADIVTKDKGVVEVKSGGARLSPGQKAVKADIDAGRSVTPRGENAAKAGLTPNQPTPMKCYDVKRC